MKRLRAAVVLVAGFACSGFFIFPLLGFLVLGSTDSGQTTLFMKWVLGIIALWLITSAVLFWRGRLGWSYALAWGPALLVFLTMH